MKKDIFAVLGGDLRSAWLAGRLCGTGHKVYAAALDKEVELSPRVHMIGLTEAIENARVVVLPLPMSCDGQYLNTPFSSRQVSLDMLFKMLAGKLVLGGRVTTEIAQLAEKYEVEIVDYFTREELMVYNSLPTAEGAIEIAMAELPTTIFGTKVLITGFGRIGKVLCRVLVAMGAKVTVAARKYSDFAWIDIHGATPVHMEALSDIACEAELVFNTVPTVVLDGTVLEKLPRDALVIDLASKPGGVDFEMAKTLGIKTIWALSLPGKTAPIFSGEVIKDTVLNILDERGCCCDND